MNSLKARETRSEIQWYSKEMIGELIRHQRYIIEVRASIEYVAKIRIILEKANDHKILIPDKNFDEHFTPDFYTDYLMNGSFQRSNAHIQRKHIK